MDWVGNNRTAVNADVNAVVLKAVMSTYDGSR